MIGDVQRTSFWERLVLSESNLAEQRCLLDDLATQQFRALVLLGDMVFSGGDDNWHYFDQLMSPLRREPLAGTGGARASEPRASLVFPGDGQPRLHGQPRASDSPVEPTLRAASSSTRIMPSLGIT